VSRNAPFTIARAAAIATSRAVLPRPSRNRISSGSGFFGASPKPPSTLSAAAIHAAVALASRAVASSVASGLIDVSRIIESASSESAFTCCGFE
jgi:hypothetical protein